MGYDRYAVVKVKEADPEEFWTIWIDSALPKGSFMKTAQGLSEDDVRAELKKMARTEAEIDWLIKQARENAF